MSKIEVKKKLTKKELVQMLLENKEIKEGDEEELLDLLIDQPIAIDIDKQEELNITFGDKMADKLSAVAGSWYFLLTFIAVLIAWIVMNGILFATSSFDPYPFILLNLVLSCVAAVQAPIIMMSQNRQNKKDSLRNHNDYRTDLKSELILEDLHDKIEYLIKENKKIKTLLEEKNEK